MREHFACAGGDRALFDWWHESHAKETRLLRNCRFLVVVLCACVGPQFHIQNCSRWVASCWAQQWSKECVCVLFWHMRTRIYAHITRMVCVLCAQRWCSSLSCRHSPATAPVLLSDFKLSSRLQWNRMWAGQVKGDNTCAWETRIHITYIYNVQYQRNTRHAR